MNSREKNVSREKPTWVNKFWDACFKIYYHDKFILGFVKR